MRAMRRHDVIKEMEIKMLDKCQSTPSRALTLPVIQIDQFFQINFPFLTERESQSQSMQGWVQDITIGSELGISRIFFRIFFR